jgi:hypothetical protein
MFFFEFFILSERRGLHFYFAIARLVVFEKEMTTYVLNIDLGEADLADPPSREPSEGVGSNHTGSSSCLL